MRRAAILLALLLAMAWAALRLTRAPTPPVRAPALRLAAARSPTPFARALAPRAFELPADHGPHFEFQTEWWYFTGHLRAPGGERFGFQLTFFRRGLTPEAPPGVGLLTNQVYFAHFALTDVERGRHLFAERFARGAPGLAGAQSAPPRVFLEDWAVAVTGADGGEMSLRAREKAMALELRLRARKPPVAHGRRGLSRKSEAPGNASYYIGSTRLEAAGQLELDGRAAPVAGSAWFDHEWSTSALGPGVRGWDWFSVQLDDGRELMFYGLRRENGGLDPVSAGTWVEPDGSARALRADEVLVEALDHWRSPWSGASYPVAFRLRVPALDLELELAALVEGQEMRASFTYWEGAVSVTGTRAGARVGGHGYVELTGYGESLAGVF